ncbi:Eco57I restriction-modification methylase domain-containing protein [Bernardetia sp. OM2101]|uniref:Eco57I restriction-modification methylase domain-containing protein n=1 Tax=Bernardetia sp. OM2101 TaxID=3344876 RepID=UPI0035CF246B
MLDNLKNIGFSEQTGLVIIDENYIKKTKHDGEILHIEERVKKFGTTKDLFGKEEYIISAVLFRRYYNQQEEIIDSKPAVYIIEKDNFVNTPEHKKLHSKIWSAGEIDVYIILDNKRIDIFNAHRPVEEGKSKKDFPLANLRLASESIKKFDDYRFSAFLFTKGVFWEQNDFSNKEKPAFFNNQLKEENSASYKLLNELLETRQKFEVNFGNTISSIVRDRFIIICLLVKFLEGIAEDTGYGNSKHTLKEIYKDKNISSFEEALKNGNVALEILEELGTEFNGKIFDISEKIPIEDRLETVNTEVRKSFLEDLSYFLSADVNIKTGQYVIWKQYDFNFIPVELISAIYEKFLPVQKAVVYTPPFLVNFLVDEVMPISKPKLLQNNQFKVLDPSCGSGVFLVAAYKRLLQWWTINKYRETGKIEQPNKEVCQEILQKNIFGTDIEETGTATLITVFSLTIALLDKLSPKEIWNNLKFDDLKENIHNENFFTWSTHTENKNFDLVIGNPPFNNDHSLTVKVTQKVLKDVGVKHTKVTKNHFALQFFEGAMTLGSRVCLIIPSSVLLYNKSDVAKGYRKNIFTDFTVNKIFDFTHLRESLFVRKGEEKKKGRVPTCAIIAQNKPSENQSIEHIVVKKTAKSEKKIRFEIDYYDCHFIRFQDAIDGSKHFIWKTNLLGGGRLFYLIKRLSLLDNLDKFISNHKKWLYNLGYITRHKNKKGIAADFITNQHTIKPKSFNEKGLFLTVVEKEKTFVETREKELYTPPHIIFKLVVEYSKIPMTFSDKYLCFNSSFVGISAPEEDKEKLYEVYDRLHVNETTSNLYRAFILATSSKALVYHETSIVKDDIDDLPYPKDNKYLLPSNLEKIVINDIVSYYRHLGKSINKGFAGEIFYNDVSKEQLKSYGEIFCQTINPMHEERGMKWQIGEVSQTLNRDFIIYQFVFGLPIDNNSFSINKNQSFKDIKFSELIFNSQENQSAIFTRLVRFYESDDDFDYLILIKPVATRYWLDSIAIRDADDTISDYYQTEK